MLMRSGIHILAALAFGFAGPPAGLAQTNLATNGDFEILADGTILPDGGETGGWRFYTKDGATGSARVSAAANSSGAVGVELVRNATGVGDSALDKDTAGLHEPVFHQQRVYMLKADLKNGGAYGATTSVSLGLQFTDTAANRTKVHVPSGTAFETIGVGALSDTNGTLSCRFSLPDGNNSVLIDNVRIYDVTDTGNRVYNGGFENSSQLVGWRGYSNGGSSEFTWSMSTDSHSGNSALRVERLTVPSPANDAAVDMDQDRIPVRPNETLMVSYWAKKLSGDTSARPFVSVLQYNASGTYIKQTLLYTANPATGVWGRGDGELVTDASAATIKVALRVGTTGNDKWVGAYLFDDIMVYHGTNLAANGSFEDQPAGEAAATAWHAFKSGTPLDYGAQITAAAASDGLVGTELWVDNTASANSSIDKDSTYLRMGIPTDSRIYKVLLDVRNGGKYGGCPNFHFETQSSNGTGYTTGTQNLTPAANWETYGKTYLSGTNTIVSFRMDMRAAGSSGYPNRSVQVDNVRFTDVTRGDRVVNGGFENSPDRLVNWRMYNLGNADEFTTALVTDAASGALALQVTRTGTPSGSDAAVDQDADRILVFPNEILNIQYSVKKVAGDADARPFVSLLEYDSAGTYLSKQTIFNTDDAPTTGFITCRHTATMGPSTQYAKIALRVGNQAGSDKWPGSFVYDDISLARVNNTPTFTSASITPVPQPATLNSVLKVIATGFSDIDGDGEQYLYQWKKNGVPIPNANTPTLTNASFSSGDSLTCVVTAYDGYEVGTAIETAPVVMPAAAVNNWLLY